MSDTKSKSFSESSSRGTKKRDSLQKKVIDTPITDGKIDREKEINTAASAYIIRVRSRLDRENETGAGKTDREKGIDTAASDYILRTRTRLDHENKTGTRKADREEDIDAAASDYILRTRSRFKSQP
ncbi:uncharacterized protein LOC144562209 isoform X1 [Carex rostrata]